MKFNLLKEKCRIFIFDRELAEPMYVHDDKVSMAYRLFTGNVCPRNQYPKEVEKCTKLKQKIEEYFEVNKEKQTQRKSVFLKGMPSPWRMDLLVGVLNVPTESNTHQRGYVKLTGIFAANCFPALCHLSDEDATVRIHCTVLSFSSPVAPNCTFSTKEMSISRDGAFNCVDDEVLFPSENFREWNSRNVFVDLTIVVTVPDDVTTGIYTSNRNKTSGITRKILESEVLSDLTIVASDGARIKAHRAFLAVHSPVFLAMFENDMKESKESTVTLPDMSEGSVKALLKYLYYNDVTECSCHETFELFSAAHQYNIDSLEDALVNLLLTKPAEWYEADVAVKFFLLARNLTPVHEELKNKAIAVLKKCGKTLESSPTFQEMFEKDAKATMEFIKSALNN